MDDRRIGADAGADWLAVSPGDRQWRADDAVALPRGPAGAGGGWRVLSPKASGKAQDADIYCDMAGGDSRSDPVLRTAPQLRPSSLNKKGWACIRRMDYIYNHLNHQ